MTQLVCWVVFPLVLSVLALGCGLLLERASGVPLPEGLLLPAGLALIIGAAEVTTKLTATADLTTPLVIVLALAGFALARVWRAPPRLGWWPLAVATLVYVAYLAPVLASGEPTFTGFIKLDDSATWMAMTDRVLSFGHDISGLPPSTYANVLRFYLTGGEPVGAMLPWGVGHQLVGQDLAWVFQPYLALGGAMLALAAWALIGPVVRSRALRAAVVFIAAQSAITYGYSLWGGIKEVSAAWVLATSVACVIPVLDARARIRSFIPLAAATGAMLGVFGFGGAVWLAVTLIVVGLAALRVWLRHYGRLQVVGLAVVAGGLGYGLYRGAQSFVNTNGALTSNELGNLVAPLRGIQLFGIWPAADFRVNPPDHPGLTHALIYVAVLAAIAGAAAAVRLRRWPLILYPVVAVVGLALTYWKGSPWVVGKALATASPAMLVIGLAGAGALLSAPKGWVPWERAAGGRWLASARRGVAGLACVAVGAGVIWSNVLAYGHVTLAPYGQMAELSRIGQRFAADGPALINEYNPYAARHFLRAMAPESPSELRFHVIPLRDGVQQVPKGGYADLDQLQLGGLLYFRTIVIRSSPAASRPPAPYRLVYDGAWYQVWRRPVNPTRPVIESIPLGNSVNPVGVAGCPQVLRLASEVGSGGLLAAAARPPAVTEAVPAPLPSGDSSVTFVVTRPGPYEVWLGGSFTRRLVTSVDGVRVGSTHEVLNEAGGWTPLGSVRLAASTHRVTLSYGDAALAPGGAGPGRAGPVFPVGPVALSPPPGGVPVTYVQPRKARSLCGKAWDWIDGLGR